MKGKQLRSEEFRLARAKDPSISQGPDCSPDPSAPNEHERQAMQLERPVHLDDSAPRSVCTGQVTQAPKLDPLICNAALSHALGKSRIKNPAVYRVEVLAPQRKS